MLKITVISVGALKESYYREAIAEYEKRSSALCRIENINLKEAPLPDDPTDGQIAAALSEEGERILRLLSPSALKVALAIEGEQLSSEEFAGMLRSAADTKGSCVFVIGSSYGLSDKVKRACDRRISFSKMTFPHRLARVILAEAIWRGVAINGGRKYHK